MCLSRCRVRMIPAHLGKTPSNGRMRRRGRDNCLSTRTAAADLHRQSNEQCHNQGDVACLGAHHSPRNPTNVRGAALVLLLRLESWCFLIPPTSELTSYSYSPDFLRHSWCCPRRGSAHSSGRVWNYQTQCLELVDQLPLRFGIRVHVPLRHLDARVSRKRLHIPQRSPPTSLTFRAAFVMPLVSRGLPLTLVFSRIYTYTDFVRSRARWA